MITQRRRRVLVIVRAGDDSLHPSWLKGGVRDERTWDLHLSYFGDQSNPFSDRPKDVTISFEKGTKAHGTVACLRGLDKRIWSYDWVWLPDDDLAADLDTVNRFFALIEAYSLDLAQPALGAGSYVTWDLTIQRPHMALRFTSYVEIMAACFSKRALRLCLPYLDATSSSWGPNHLFPKLLGYPKDKIAIIDETPVVHTRPVAGGPNISLVRSYGIRPEDELQSFLAKHRLTRRLETYGGITRDGMYITDLSEIDRVKVEVAEIRVKAEAAEGISKQGVAPIRRLKQAWRRAAARWERMAASLDRRARRRRDGFQGSGRTVE